MSMKRSIIYDQRGNVVVQLHNTPVESVGVVEVEADWEKVEVERVDMEAGEVILKEIPLTPEQQRIKELEDALLLATDNEVGGIL